VIARATDTIAIWLDRGVPARLVWRGARYTVTDRPTPLRGQLDSLPVAISHPFEPIIGWRFQCSGEAGQTRMFDVRRDRDSWELVGAHD
jgi:hypothetical protein